MLQARKLQQLHIKVGYHHLLCHLHQEVILEKLVPQSSLGNHDTRPLRDTGCDRGAQQLGVLSQVASIHDIGDPGQQRTAVVSSSESVNHQGYETEDVIAFTEAVDKKEEVETEPRVGCGQLHLDNPNHNARESSPLYTDVILGSQQPETKNKLSIVHHPLSQGNLVPDPSILLVVRHPDDPRSPLVISLGLHSDQGDVVTVLTASAPSLEKGDHVDVKIPRNVGKMFRLWGPMGGREMQELSVNAESTRKATDETQICEGSRKDMHKPQFDIHSLSSST